MRSLKSLSIISVMLTEELIIPRWIFDKKKESCNLLRFSNKNLACNIYGKVKLEFSIIWA